MQQKQERWMIKPALLESGSFMWAYGGEQKKYYFCFGKSNINYTTGLKYFSVLQVIARNIHYIDREHSQKKRRQQDWACIELLSKNSIPFYVRHHLTCKNLTEKSISQWKTTNSILYYRAAFLNYLSIFYFVPN